MAIKKLFAIGTVAVIVTIVAGTAAQAAYVATTTIYGSGVKTLSVLECKAVAATSTYDDASSTTEVEGYPCSSVTARAFYTTTDGHALWTNTVTSTRQATVTITGSNELQKSYNTATR